jgi:hypothetical protein
MPRVSRGGLDAAAVQRRRTATRRRCLMASQRAEERQIGGGSRPVCFRPGASQSQRNGNANWVYFYG